MGGIEMNKRENEEVRMIPALEMREWVGCSRPQNSLGAIHKEDM